MLNWSPDDSYCQRIDQWRPELHIKRNRGQRNSQIIVSKVIWFRTYLFFVNSFETSVLLLYIDPALENYVYWSFKLPWNPVYETARDHMKRMCKVTIQTEKNTWFYFLLVSIVSTNTE